MVLQWSISWYNSAYFSPSQGETKGACYSSPKCLGSPGIIPNTFEDCCCSFGRSWNSNQQCNNWWAPLNVYGAIMSMLYYGLLTGSSYWLACIVNFSKYLCVFSISPPLGGVGQGACYSLPKCQGSPGIVPNTYHDCCRSFGQSWYSSQQCVKWWATLNYDATYSLGGC